MILEAIAKLVRPTELVLLVVVFWQMRQNSLLIKEVFDNHKTMQRLTGLLEKLVYAKKDD